MDAASYEPVFYRTLHRVELPKPIPKKEGEENVRHSASLASPGCLNTKLMILPRKYKIQKLLRPRDDPLALTYAAMLIFSSGTFKNASMLQLMIEL